MTIGFWSSGYYPNRQPLFHPLRNIGIQVVSYVDALIDGVNIELTDQFTLKRRAPFVKYCSAQLAASEVVKQFYSVRNLAGNVTVFADTNQNLYKVTPSALTSLNVKSSSNQGYVQQVGNMTYYSTDNGSAKWDGIGSALTGWGIAAPVVVPTLTGNFWYPSGNALNITLLDPNGNLQLFSSFVSARGATTPTWANVVGALTQDGGSQWECLGPMDANGWVASQAYALFDSIVDTNGNIQYVSTAGTSDTTVPTWSKADGGNTTDNSVTWTVGGHGMPLAYAGYSYVYAYRTVYGHLSTASPVSVNTGAIFGPQQAPITAFEIGSDVATFTAAHNFFPGDVVRISGLSVGTYLNGLSGTVSSVTSTTFSVFAAHVDVTLTSDGGTATPSIAGITVHGTSNSQCNSTASVTQITVSNNIGTATAANNFSPGIWIEFDGLSGASWLNDVQVQVTSATPTQFTFTTMHADYGPTSDSGTAIFCGLEIYRTKDGGGVYYFAGAVLNPGGSSNQTFVDTLADSALLTALTAPLAHINDPPPGLLATGSTVGTFGTIIVYWNGRMWMAVGNKVYFSAGPDCLNGIPEECWPPAYFFTFPGNITAMRVQSGGVEVHIADEVWAILGGPQTVAFYQEQVMSHTGVSNNNCIAPDGTDLYAYTTGRQLFNLGVSPRDETGFRVGNVLTAGIAGLATISPFAPASSSITVHRNGYDQGLWISNGVDTLLRYGLGANACWSTPYQPLLNGSVGIGVVKSVETAAGIWSLLLASSNANDYIYYRNYGATTYQDNGNSYDAAAVPGNITVTEPGQPLQPVYFLSLYGANVGNVPAMSFLPNEIGATGGAAFTVLPVAQNEPALLPGSKSIMSKRWPTLSNASPTPVLVRHLQAKIDYGTDTVPNELYMLGIGYTLEQST